MYSINNPLRVISLFSGVGAYEEALRQLNISHEIVHFSEITRAAINSYCILNNISKDKNLGDIKNINPEILEKNIDLVTFSFPCQDISIIGQQKGFENNTTKSGLVYNAIEIIKHVRPKFAIFENVKNIIGKKFINQFNLLLDIFEGLGYKVKYKLINSLNYGIPQNRERVFGVLIRNDVQMENIFDNKLNFANYKVQDFLEYDADEKYYNTTKNNIYMFDLNNVLNDTTWRNKKERMFINQTIQPTLLSRNPKFERAFHGRLYSRDIKDVDVNVSDIIDKIKNNNIKIRVLTPFEYFRLMGFSDESFYKLKEINISDSALYKMAGNSIVVNILVSIFNNMFHVKH